MGADDKLQATYYKGEAMGDDANSFDGFRDANPGWQRLTPFEIALLFWRGGRVHEQGKQGDE
jgi:hypothetical protein